MFGRILLPKQLEFKLNAHFERTRDHFSRLKAKAPEAIVLGGGYGRGGEMGWLKISQASRASLTIWTILFCFSKVLISHCHAQ